MRYSRSVIICICCSALIGSARAEDDGYVTAEKQTFAYLDMFFSICGSSDFTPELMEELAAEREWPEVPALLKLSNQPSSSPLFHNGWVATIDEFIPIPVHIFASRVQNAREPVIEFCAIYMRTALVEEFIPLALDQLENQIISDERHGPDRVINALVPDDQNSWVTLWHEVDSGDGRGVSARAAYVRDR